MPLEAFTVSEPLTMGVELELQLLDTLDFDLAPRAAGPAARAGQAPRRLGREARDHAQHDRDRHLDPARARRRCATSCTTCADQLSRGARKLNIGIGGGGTHAFQHWSEQQIYPTERFHYISELYGYLAKQFTVFGQHVHIGVPERRRRAVAAARAVALRAALHRAVAPRRPSCRAWTPASIRRG